MKNYCYLLLCCVLLFSCRKAIESAQEDLVIKAMTDGQWRVTKYIKGAADLSPDFSQYTFQFKSNETVDAITNATVENTGTWKGDAAARTIVSSFTNATPTVTLLNGTWQITKNSWTFVEATQTVNGEIRSLRLDK